MMLGDSGNPKALNYYDLLIDDIPAGGRGISLEPLLGLNLKVFLHVDQEGVPL